MQLIRYCVKFLVFKYLYEYQKKKLSPFADSNLFGFAIFFPFREHLCLSAEYLNISHLQKFILREFPIFQNWFIMRWYFGNSSINEVT